MAVGKIGFRQKGSAGGHNGIKSIVKYIGTQEFDRIKIGIGRPKREDECCQIIFIRIDAEDRIEIDLALDKLDSAVNFYLEEDDFEAIMRKFNG